MKLPHNVSLVLRGQIARAAMMASATEPLRLVVRRKVPLTRQREKLGHLDVLLRLSCRGRGQGDGVLVFEWPCRASGHSAIQTLENWSNRCGKDATRQLGMLELERRDAVIPDEGSSEVPGVHFKVGFPLSEIPDVLLDLLDLAARIGLAEAVRSEVDRHQKPANEVPAPEPEPPAHAEQAPIAPSRDQAMIDKIVHNAVFDAKVHPHVNPNEEVCTSDGTVFRLVMKRAGGVPTRTWIHVRNGATTEPCNIDASDVSD